jgi:hypothetical protein
MGARCAISSSIAIAALRMVARERSLSGTTELTAMPGRAQAVVLFANEISGALPL